MDPGAVMLGEISHTQKDKYCVIKLTGGPRGVRFIETESRWWGAGAGGAEGSECLGR